MRASRLGLFAVLALALTVSVAAHSLGRARLDPSWQTSETTAAQSAPPTTSEAAKPQEAASGARRHEAPCWRVAGIASALVNQRWHIEDNAKGKIHLACIDPTTNAEKKREKIREINEEAEQEIAKIIPAKQLEAFKACQAERDQEKPRRAEVPGEKQLGPCGGTIPAEKGASEHPHEHQPGNPPNQ